MTSGFVELQFLAPKINVAESDVDDEFSDFVMIYYRGYCSQN